MELLSLYAWALGKLRAAPHLRELERRVNKRIRDLEVTLQIGKNADGEPKQEI